MRFSPDINGYPDGLGELRAYRFERVSRQQEYLKRQRPPRLDWQYLGLPENRSVTYVPILTCPDDVDLDCTVRVVEQRYDEKFVYWERFGALIDDIEKQNAEAIEWFIGIPKVIFDRDNFIQVFKQLNSEISKEYYDRGEEINIPFPAKPIKEEWEKIVDSWF